MLSSPRRLPYTAADAGRLHAAIVCIKQSCGTATYNTQCCEERGMRRASTEQSSMRSRWVVLIAALSFLAAGPVAAAMRAGAARLDITPDAKALPKGIEGINDPIFVRAIVVEDGRTRAGLVTVDAGAIPTEAGRR